MEKNNVVYEGFKRKIAPHCNINSSSFSTVSLKTTWRAATPFGLCTKYQRKTIQRFFGWNTSFDVASEVPQIYQILGNKSQNISNRSIYRKLIKNLKWEQDPVLMEYFDNDYQKLLSAIKKSVVRVISLDDLPTLHRVIRYNHLLPSIEYVDQLYEAVKNFLGFMDPDNTFYYTSFVEILTLVNLRKRGIFVENCYDEFYYNSKEITAKEIREELTRSCQVLRNLMTFQQGEIKNGKLRYG